MEEDLKIEAAEEAVAEEEDLVVEISEIEKVIGEEDSGGTTIHNMEDSKLQKMWHLKWKWNHPKKHSTPTNFR